ncbi:MAG TPA: nicotinate-nucleotide diphosphorylase (carboxylating), partial [Gemmatimonadales bacterium]|nr:nicotinate-nucleotide diphosphorylase (carboxylating) [Gemmatimonadales bacterium]
MPGLTDARLLADAAAVAERALAEDGASDVTSLVTVPASLRGRGVFEVRHGTVIAGLPYADAVAERCGLGAVAWRVREGEPVPGGTVAGSATGSMRALLRAERSMLNLLQRASGIATATRAYVDAVRHTRCTILHTRKTAPGLRTLDVAAVLAGGGGLHRLDLERTVMVKDNHWQALRQGGRTLADALDEARRLGVAGLQVEVERPEQVDEAARAGATRLLVDNQTPATVRAWAERARALAPAIEIEATGGIT